MTNRVVKALTLIVSGLFLLCPAKTLVAQAPTLQFSTEAQKVYKQVTGLQKEYTRIGLVALERSDPNNQAAVFLAHLQDFLMFMMTEDPSRYTQLLKKAESRLEAISRVTGSNPWRAYCLGEMYLMNGIAAYKRNEIFLATRSFRSGVRLIRKGAADFPNFLPLQKDRHVIEALIGTVPDQYQWAAELATGMQADKDEAQALEAVYAAMKGSNYFLTKDAGFFLAIIYAHQYRKPEEAFRIASELISTEPDQPFLQFLFAYTAAESKGMQSEAIQLLQRALPTKESLTFPYLAYMSGKYKLNALDIPGARASLQQFLLKWQGSSYQSEAWQKMAWCALLEDDLETYHRFMTRTLKAPDSPMEGDQQAKKEARDKQVPHPVLLRARLAFDGRDPLRAKAILESIQSENLREQRFLLEYDYRMGRVLADLDKSDNNAIRFYTRAWTNGKGNKLHFACASALQLGDIYSDLRKPKEARRWYDRCLAEKPDIYRSGLHQKAKAGIRRLRH